MFWSSSIRPSFVCPVGKPQPINDRFQTLCSRCFKDMLPGTLLRRRRVSVVLLIAAMVGLLLPHHTVAFHFRPRYWRSAAGTRIDWSLLATSAGRGSENTQTGSHQTTTLQESQPTGTFVDDDDDDDAAGEGDDLADIERELWLEDEKELQMSADMHVDDTTAAITTVSTTGNDNDNDEPDINLVAETEMDRSIANAVKSLLDEGPKEPELSPVEKFNQMYKVRAADRGAARAPSTKTTHPLTLSLLFVQNTHATHARNKTHDTTCNSLGRASNLAQRTAKRRYNWTLQPCWQTSFLTRKRRTRLTKSR